VDEAVESVEWKTKKSLRVGSRITFVGTLLGRRFTYTYEVTELVPLERLVMRTADGPFALETTYTCRTLRPDDANDAPEPGSADQPVLRLTARLMASAMRRTNGNDLARLKEILEAA